MIHKTESAKYRQLTEKFCTGCGIDLASKGDPVVPWAWSLDLPEAEFKAYNNNEPAHGPIQLRGDAAKLPVESDSLDFVFSSHLLEDFLNWDAIIVEWVRVLKKGGKLIILLPDKERWAAALAKGQSPNCAHKHESYAGELSKYAEWLGLKVIEDRLTDFAAEDYTILFVAEKP